MHFDYTNLSAPLPAEMYVDFGVLGVCFMPILIGIALEKPWTVQPARHCEWASFSDRGFFMGAL